MIEHIIINVIIYFLGALAFSGFMADFNKKNYFSAGCYLFILIGVVIMFVRFLISLKP